MSTRALTPKEAHFVEEYLVDLDAANAVRRTPGYSDRRAKQTGHELLQRPYIQEAIAARMAERAEETRIRAYRVLEELATVAFSDVDHYVLDDDGRITLAAGAPSEAMRAVASVKRRKTIRTEKGGDTVETIDVEFKLWNKPEAIRMAGQHLRLFREIVETRDGTLEDLIREASGGDGDPAE